MISVINPGMLTTVQDAGRWGWQAYGMPVAGVMDRFAFTVINMLAGNDKNAAVLEMTLTGGSFRFEEAAWAAIGGADMQADLNGVNVRNWSSFYIPAGSELSFGFALKGCRSYLAVQGGFDVPEVLGSRSTYLRAGIGGFAGRALKSGDMLKIGAASSQIPYNCALPVQLVPDYGGETILRVMLGPQEDLFTTEGIETLFGGTYTVTNESDRMGCRLDGPVIKHAGKPDIVSDALCRGAIQVPGHGMPIIMLADCQTTGGYAKIGTVIGPDLTRLAQAKPGDAVRFKLVSDAEAVGVLRAERELYGQIAAWIAEKKDVYRSRRFNVKVNGQVYLVEMEEA